jgi:hypothetical protein
MKIKIMERKEDYLSPDERKNYDAAIVRIAIIKDEISVLNKEWDFLQSEIYRLNLAQSDRWMEEWRIENNVPPKNKRNE